MTLYEYVKEKETDFDTYDMDYDAVITVCYIDEINDNYEKFCVELMKKVNVIGILKSGFELVVNWSDLVDKNFELFKDFTNKYWKQDYEDKDEFIYQWLTEIQNYIVGNVPDSFYKILCDFLETLK